MGDWKSPINFALGYFYGKSDSNSSVKEVIEYFLGNELQGRNITDLVNNYEYYSFDSADDAYDYIDGIIEKLEHILFGAVLSE